MSGIPPWKFYSSNKTKNIEVITNLPDPMDSDLEDIEITDDEEDVYNSDKEYMEIDDISPDNSDWSDEDELPLSQMQNILQKTNLTWHPDEDNRYANNLPVFMGQYSINIHGQIH